MKPNILFISIGSLRNDRCFGKNRNAKTPNLDSLIKKAKETLLGLGYI